MVNKNSPWFMEPDDPRLMAVQIENEMEAGKGGITYLVGRSEDVEVLPTLIRGIKEAGIKKAFASKNPTRDLNLFVFTPGLDTIVLDVSVPEGWCRAIDNITKKFVEFSLKNDFTYNK